MRTAPGAASEAAEDTGTSEIDFHHLTDIIRRSTPPGPPEEGVYDATCVFMLLFDAPRPQILFIQKADTEGYPWRNQVALPGGHRDPEDASPLQAAFRELREELGIPPEQVRLIGSLGHFQTLRGKDIEVFIGRWDESGPLRHDTHEIARVLPIPLKALVRIHQARGFHGRLPDTDQLRYPFDGLVIWGATARIVHYFIELTFPALPPGHWKTTG